MDEEAGFLDAIRSNPAEETARLVYADWLDEQGDDLSRNKAELIRLEVQMLAPPEQARERVRLQTQIRHAATGLDLDWLLLLTHPRLESCELQFKFACPRQWAGLVPTEDAKTRFCKACRLHVHYCDTIEEAQEHTAKGHCIAVSVAVPRRAFDTRPPRPGPPKFIADRRGRSRVPLWVLRGVEFVPPAIPITPTAPVPVLPPAPLPLALVSTTTSATRVPGPAPKPTPVTVKGWKSKKQQLRHRGTPQE